MKFTIGVLVLLVLFSTSTLAQSTFTTDTEQHCKGESCTLTLYSGTRFVFEDSKWKRVEDANSLMGVYEVRYLQDDGSHDFKIVDFDYYSITFDAYVKDAKDLGKLTPIKVDGVEVTSHMFTGLNNERRWTVTGSKPIVEMNFTLGSASTTIVLVSPYLNMLADNNLAEQFPDTVLGTGTQGSVQGRSSDRRRDIFKFNISQVPSGQVIDDASLGLTAVSVGGNPFINVHDVFEPNWHNETVTWNNQPCGTAVPFSGANSSACNLVAASSTQITANQRINLTVTSPIARAYDAGLVNASIILVPLLESEGSNYRMNHWTINFGTVSSRPNLTITYSAAPSGPTFSNFLAVPLDSDEAILGDVTWFNSNNLSPIEFMMLNFTVTSGNGDLEDNMTLWFAGNGSNACSLGNLQNNRCIIYPEYVQFLNGTNTSTYDGRATGGNRGDSITCSFTGSSTEKNYSCIIDEHYNPNVFKWYDALYNFSNKKWQEGTDQKITQNQQIRVQVNQSLVPVNADFYKFDIRINTSTIVPSQPLELWACNSSYTTEDVTTTNMCSFVTQKLQSEFQDDGTKFRGIGTNNLVNSTGDFGYVVLRTEESNPNRYYTILTYEATQSSYTQKWLYRDGDTASWNNLADGFESEFNINWFSNGQVNSTNVVFKITATDQSATINSSEFNVMWNITPTQNLAPVIAVFTPTDNQSVFGNSFDITWITAEPNMDGYFTNITLSNGTNSTLLALNLTSGTFSFAWDTTAWAETNYTLTVGSCENETASLLCGVNTRIVHVEQSSCPEIWTCTGWVQNGTFEYRQCVELSSCGTTDNKPETRQQGMDSLIMLLIPMFAGLMFMAAGFLVDKEEHMVIKNFFMLTSLTMIIPVLTFAFTLQNSEFSSTLSGFLWIMIVVLFFLFSYYMYYFAVKIMTWMYKRKIEKLRY